MTSGSDITVPHILIIDDDHDDHFFLSNAISELVPQAKIESLFDGLFVADYFRDARHLPDVIFLDLNMIILSGRETLRLIRQDTAGHDVPVVILSTSKNEDEKQQLLLSGANAFYSKPYANKELLRIVAEVKDQWLQTVGR